MNHACVGKESVKKKKTSVLLSFAVRLKSILKIVFKSEFTGLCL